MTDQKSNTGNVCPTHGESDTPRVDAAIATTPGRFPDFARTLERELAAMTKECERLNHILATADGEIERLKLMCQMLDTSAEDFELRKERDALRARVAELESAASNIRSDMVDPCDVCGNDFK